MPPRTLLLSAVCLSALVLVPTAATKRQGGGGSIAAAPGLQYGQQVNGGGTMSCDGWNTPNSGAEYFRAPLSAGDVLVLDYGSLNGQSVSVDVLHANETDYTLSNVHEATYDYTSGKSELRFRANVGGNWIVVVHGGDCGDFGYQMLPTVEHKTPVTFRAPARVRAGASVTVRGTVQNASEGQVSLQYHNGGGWHTFTSADINSDGVFSAQITYNGRCRTHATWTNRAVYAGDDTHAAGISNVVVARSSC